jgi:hypothetical protein
LGFEEGMNLVGTRFGLLGLMAVAATLGACSSKSTPALAPTATEPVISSQPLEPLPTGQLSAGQITRALGEKTFTFASSGRRGNVTFYNDGTFEYQETGKGAGTGVWQATDGKLCEARNPTSFLPKGTPSICNPISSDGTRFTAGGMQLIPS